MKRKTTWRTGSFLIAGAAAILVTAGTLSCSKKSSSSKTAKASLTSEPASNTPVPPSPPAAEEKEGMQITRDAAGNYVIHLLLKDLQPVKLMKPAKEGYVVWMVNDKNITTNIGTIEGANTWTDKKDRSVFNATATEKPVKLFITAETNLQAEKPGTQVVWSTRNY